MFQNLNLSNKFNFSLNGSRHDGLQDSINIHLILNKICDYEYFVTVPLGIIGNLISIFIFTRPSLNKKTNTGLLFTILCVINLLVILNKVIFYWSFTRKIIKILQIHFKMEKFIEKVIEQSLSWIQSMITFDRFITVYSPLKGARLMNKKWILFSIIFGIFVLISSVNSIHFVIYSSPTSSAYKQIYPIYDRIDKVMKIFIPYLIIVVFDLMVILRLRGSKRQVGERQPRRSRSSRFTINTIIIDLLFVIFNFPDIFMFFANFSIFGLDVFLVRLVYDLFSNIYSYLFFILFFIFNRIFRHEFISIFTHNSCFNNINTSSS